MASTSSRTSVSGVDTANNSPIPPSSVLASSSADQHDAGRVPLQDLAAPVVFSGTLSIYLERLGQIPALEEIATVCEELEAYDASLDRPVPFMSPPTGVNELQDTPLLDERIRQLKQKLGSCLPFGEVLPPRSPFKNQFDEEPIPSRKLVPENPFANILLPWPAGPPAALNELRRR
ncbi:hypothetical protein CC86DRAFT_413473 [Ophiobolus disseminans]|uniref:Uncharacterized protein n=1 Tax=Ophiobolus disseminans TaxID=1469910 RepID=A0A6A6ZCH0_9PLEO|nr:hypothetical protein CC86DRAFT_413473 [Ophiobolus disseminans]